MTPVHKLLTPGELACLQSAVSSDGIKGNTYPAWPQALPALRGGVTGSLT